MLAYISRGNVHRDKDDLDKAIVDYSEAIRVDPKDARGWRNRGMMYLFKNDNKKGVADYDKAVLLDPADVNSWNNRGQGRMRTGDKQGAIADFRKALELKPGLPTALESLKKLGAAPLMTLPAWSGTRDPIGLVEDRSQAVRTSIADRCCLCFAPARPRLRSPQSAWRWSSAITTMPKCRSWKRPRATRARYRTR